MSSDSSGLMTILTQLSYHIPYFLVFLVGIVIAFINLKNHKMPAVLALIALFEMGVAHLGQGIIQGFLIEQLKSGNSPGSSTSTMLSVVGWLSAILRAAGIGLLVTAVFIGRSKPRNSSDD